MCVEVVPMFNTEEFPSCRHNSKCVCFSYRYNVCMHCFCRNLSIFNVEHSVCCMCNARVAKPIFWQGPFYEPSPNTTTTVSIYSL